MTHGHGSACAHRSHPASTSGRGHGASSCESRASRSSRSVGRDRAAGDGRTTPAGEPPQHRALDLVGVLARAEGPHRAVGQEPGVGHRDVQALASLVDADQPGEEGLGAQSLADVHRPSPIASSGEVGRRGLCPLRGPLASCPA